jgi:hypothetical protein
VKTSVTLPRSVALRLRHLAGRIHQLGPKPLFELFCEIAHSDESLARLETYGALDGDFIRLHGGDQFQSNIFLIQENNDE